MHIEQFAVDFVQNLDDAKYIPVPNNGRGEDGLGPKLQFHIKLRIEAFVRLRVVDHGGFTLRNNPAGNPFAGRNATACQFLGRHVAATQDEDQLVVVFIKHQ